MLRALAGYLAVVALQILGVFPPRLIVLLGTPWLPLYASARQNVRLRLKHLKSRVSFPVPSPLAYYRMRLRLAALSLRHLTGHYEDCSIRVEGKEHYQAACASGKPVVILGWHQGPVELLHRIPSVHSKERPFYVATIGGFTSPLSKFLKQGRKQEGKEIVDSKSLSAALRSWVRRCGVLAVMVDQVPARPKDWIGLWNNTIKIPFPRNLWDWLKNRGAVFIAVSVHLEDGGSIYFQYQPVPPHANVLEGLMMEDISQYADQYNWSYRKIRPDFN